MIRVSTWKDHEHATESMNPPTEKQKEPSPKNRGPRRKVHGVLHTGVAPQTPEGAETQFQAGRIQASGMLTFG